MYLRVQCAGDESQVEVTSSLFTLQVKVFSPWYQVSQVSSHVPPSSTVDPSQLNILPIVGFASHTAKHKNAQLVNTIDN